MTKQLSMVAALVIATGAAGTMACKTDAPAQQQSAAPASDDSSAKARSAKIDIKPMQPPTAQPALPTPPADTPADHATVPPPGDNPAPRAEWRRRRDARLDTNGDGMVSGEERDVAMKERMANMRTRLDTDGDGKVTPAELTAARGRMHFDNAEALDTNHDGDISADELAAGFKARRDQIRSARGAGPGGPSADDTAGTGTTPQVTR
ncbi:MAG TPA: hypothetical protein VLM79_22410 [Kofleriaceae bacterium]|nr:hypothetical protein [Kofleriaceae bacterium]